MDRWYNISWNKVIDKLESDINRGLSTEEVNKRKEAHGANIISISVEKNSKIMFFKLLLNPWILIMLATFAVFIYFNYFIQAGISILLTILTIFIRYYEIAKSSKELSLLNGLNYTTTRVIRNGTRENINSEELVVGDIVVLRQNQRVPADMRVVESEELKVNEKNVTGESFLVEKYETMIEGRVNSLSEMKNILFKGSTIVNGDGLGVVVSIGDDTQLGKNMKLLTSSGIRKNTVGKKIERKLNITAAYVTLAIIGIGIINYFLNGKNNDLNLMANTIFSLETIGYIVILILFVYFYKKDLKSKGIEIINLSVLDTEEKIDIIFLEKIGSISEDKMIVKKIFTDEKIYDNKDGDNNEINLQRIINIGLLTSNAIYNVNEDTGRGDITEIALLRLGASRGIYKSLLMTKQRRIFEIPYDTERRIVTSVNKVEKKYRANVRGAVDEVLSRCTHIMKEGVEKEITEEDMQNIRNCDYNFSIEGLVTTAFAYRSFGYEPSPDENIESNLVFVGIMAMLNPYIPESDETIRTLQRNKIAPMLITEDNKIAATKVSTDVGLIRGMDEVISGVEFDSLNDEEIINVLSKTKVFSRISYDMKNKIINMFINDGYNVAVLGEDLTDLPVLSASQVGISKGEKCSSLVKKLSDVYIKEDCLHKFLELLKISTILKRNIYLANSLLVYSIILLISSMFIPNLFGLEFNRNIYITILENLIAIPLLAVAVLFNDRYVKKERGIANILITALLPVFLINIICMVLPYVKYDVIMTVSVYPLLLIKAFMIFEISPRRFGNALKFMLMGFGTYLITSILGTYIFYGFTFKEIVVCGIFLVLYALFEFLLNKWK